MYSQMYTDYTPVSQFMKFYVILWSTSWVFYRRKDGPFPGAKTPKLSQQIADNAPVKNIEVSAWCAGVFGAQP